MEARPRRIEHYEDAHGVSPFEVWMGTLVGQRIHGKILARLDRVAQGNFGEHHGVGEGVSELVIDFGPGYRVYYGLDGAEQEIFVTLGGGTKNGQSKDIADAQERWGDYNA